MPDPAVRDATIIRQALSGDVIDLKAATEVICSRTSTQIQHVKQIYRARFNAYIEHDIEYQATGDLKKVLALSPSLSYWCWHPPAVYQSPSVIMHIFTCSICKMYKMMFHRTLRLSFFCFVRTVYVNKSLTYT